LNDGSYARIGAIESLWHAWLQCRRGKRRTPAIAEFDIDCDRHLLALSRELAQHRYAPGPARLHAIRDPKVRLIAARTAIVDWLRVERGLELNPKHWAVVPTVTPGVFVGYRISRAGITPSRKLRRRLPAKLRAAAARGEDELARTITSYRGLLLFP